MCGVATLTLPPIDVSRRGSVSAQLGTWRAVLVSRDALGAAPSPERVEGHLCLACTHAIDEVGGIGWRARGHAVAAYLGRLSPRAEELRSMFVSNFPTTLPAWGTAVRSPNSGRGRTCQSHSTASGCRSGWG